MSKYTITEDAYSSMDKILEHIKQHNPLASRELEKNIFNACEFLAANPFSGRMRFEFTDKPLRFWVIKTNYIIVYSLDESGIIIRDVLHAARDLHKLI